MFGFSALDDLCRHHRPNEVTIIYWNPSLWFPILLSSDWMGTIKQLTTINHRNSVGKWIESIEIATTIRSDALHMWTTALSRKNKNENGKSVNRFDVIMRFVSFTIDTLECNKHNLHHAIGCEQFNYLQKMLCILNFTHISFVNKIQFDCPYAHALTSKSRWNGECPHAYAILYKVIRIVE